MSLFAYNDVVLEVIKVDSIESTPIYDANNYLYTKYRVSVKGVYNGSATSYLRTGDKDIPNDQDRSIRRAKGWLPCTTSEAIREKMMQPRRLMLLVDDFGNTILRSPLVGTQQDPDLVDAKNGPIPIRCNVEKITGSVTWQVKFIVETHLNEQHLYSNASYDSPLLGHTWKMSEYIDERHRTTRTINGRATFNAEKLRSLGRVPDDFRKHLFPSVPRRFKRQSVNVTVSEDNTTINYTIVDKSKKWYYKKSGIVDVKVTETASSQTKDFMSVLGSVGSSTAAGIAAGATRGPWGAVISGVASFFGGVMSSTPGVSITYNVMVAGDTRVSIATLSASANAILANRIRLSARKIGISLLTGGFAINMSESQDVGENIVSLSATFVANTISRTRTAIGNIQATGLNVLNSPPHRRILSNSDTADSTVASTEPNAIPARGSETPLEDNGTRQDTLVAIFSAAAQDAAFSRQSPEDTIRTRRDTDAPHRG